MTVRRPSRPRARRLAAVALVPVLALLGACTGDDDAPNAPSGQELKIGLLAPITGPNEGAGKAAQQGAQLAADVINGLNPSIPLPLAAGAGLPNLGGARVTVVPEDVGRRSGSPQLVAGDAVNKLVSVQGVDALIGAYDPLITEYASQRSERYEVPFINADSPATYLTDAGRDWFFRVGPTWRSSGEAFFALLRGKKDATRKVAVLYARDKAGQDVLTTVTELATEGGGTEILEYGFSLDGTDLQPQVDKLVAAQPDALLVYATPRTTPPLLAALGAKNFRAKAAMSFSSGSVTAAQLGPNSQGLEGVLRTVSWAQEAAARNPAAQAVTQLYKRRYNADMTEAAASAFTAVMTIAQAANDAGSTEDQKVRSALLSLNVPGEQTIMPWSGVQFDETHQNVLAQSLIEQYSGQSFKIVYPPDATAARTTLQWPAKGASSGA